MKKLIWVVLFIILLLVVLWLWLQPSSQSQDMPRWPTIAAEHIHNIVIQKPSGSLIGLKWQQKQWQLDNGDIAEQQAVLRLINDLTTMQVIRVVTRTKQYDDVLGIGKRGVKVICLDDKGHVLLDIMVGKQGSDLLSTYVRRKGSGVVVAVNRALVWQVQRSKLSWKLAKKES